MYAIVLFGKCHCHTPISLTGGARAETSTRVKAGEGYDAEGVRGLKALGVRDLTYRLAFLACSVQQTQPGVREECE